MPKRLLRTDLLEKAEFWAAHLWNVTRGPLATCNPCVFDATLGIETDRIEKFYLQELNDEQIWPYFHISLPAGFEIEIEYVNEPEDHQVVYRVRHEKSAASLCVGKGGGHWQLPAFRWPEVSQIGKLAVRSGSSILLLLPAVWITSNDNLADIRRELTAAWQDLNPLPRSQVTLLVENLISSSSQSNVRWHHEEARGWINDGHNSTRNPNSPGRLNPAEFSTLLNFFSSIT